MNGGIGVHGGHGGSGGHPGASRTERRARARWSIRTRAAVAFGTLALVLVSAVLVFVNVMAQRGVVTVLRVDGAEVGSTTADGRRAPPSVRPGTASTAGPGGPPSAGHVAVGPAPASPAPGPLADPQSPAALGGIVAGQQWLWSAVGVAGATVLAAGAGWLVARSVLRPVQAIRDTTERISATTLHERIALAGPDDELRRLADTIDAVIARLEQAFAAQRRFVAQASHELRTPLAVQRAAIQIGLEDGVDAATLRSVREDLLEANRRSEHLVEGLLALAEADRGLDAATPIDVADLVAQVVAAARGRAVRAGRSLRFEAQGRWPTRGDAVLVRHLVENLVDNALEYNVPDGEVLVTVGPGRLVVENTGPSVPADRLATLTQPFTRLDREAAADARPEGVPTRRHSGIGLSVVASVVRAHGWHLALSPRAGGGLVVRVTGVSSV